MTAHQSCTAAAQRHWTTEDTETQRTARQRHRGGGTTSDGRPERSACPRAERREGPAPANCEDGHVLRSLRSLRTTTPWICCAVPLRPLCPLWWKCSSLLWWTCACPRRPLWG